MPDSGLIESADYNGVPAVNDHDSPIVLEPRAPADACVIWLHGLGADGHDFVPMVEQLQVPAGLRFVFPHAPMQPVTINGGYVMRSWYDIAEQDLQRKPDLAGIAESVAYLQQLIDEQHVLGIARSRLLLAGFSQGGVVVTDCALRLSEKPAGVLALSTYLAEAVGDGQGLHLFQAHGEQDDIVPVSAADRALDQLRMLGAQVETHRYPMGHQVHPREIADIGRWISQRLENND